MSTPDERMCPCGCGETWNTAVREMMRGPAAYNRDQAEYLLGQTAKYLREQATSDDHNLPPAGTDEGEEG